MTALDTSVVVAAFAPWHESHGLALEALSRRPRLVAHMALETYAVLTRLPAPHRAPPDVVVEFLKHTFTEEPLALPPVEQLDLLGALPPMGITGGAAYDALVAATAAHAGATLVTLDRRAVPTYRAVGGTIELLG